MRVGEDAEDLVQITAEKAMRAKKSPTQDSEYRKWLFRILRNAFIDLYRKSRQLEGTIALDDTHTITATSADLVDVLSVKQGLQKLNLEYREVIYLVDIIGFSYSEAADVLHIPIGTVMSRLSRSRKALLALLSTTKAPNNLHSNNQVVQLATEGHRNA